jgi:hypothetical protein
MGAGFDTVLSVKAARYALPRRRIIRLQRHVTDNFPTKKATRFPQRTKFCAPIDYDVVRVKRDDEVFVITPDHYLAPKSLTRTTRYFTYYGHATAPHAPTMT